MNDVHFLLSASSKSYHFLPRKLKHLLCNNSLDLRELSPKGYYQFSIAVWTCARQLDSKAKEQII